VTTRLLLDEMHQPVVADLLRQRGHDVLALVADPMMRAMADDEVFAWAAREGRRIVTENVKDFRRLLLAAGDGASVAPLLFTSSRSFPRSRRNPGPLVDALDAWLTVPGAERRPVEDWLLPR
jgi:nucleoside-diphosphate-sugar epimerase